jgi:hypothetical protein
MGILKITLGFLALVLAWSLLFRTGLIFRLNAWIKENVLNDQIVLYSRRRLAFLLLALGVVSLFSGVENLGLNLGYSGEAKAAMVSKIQSDFKSRQYTQVVANCRLLLKTDPKNIPIREFLINSLWALGNKEAALKEARMLSHVSPTNATAKVVLSKSKQLKSGSN